ncbi:hypothetical protein BX261_3346 [Streptomyces sp. 2321.6]|nr:hypothetical protein BX261_3346 [Streptomyces sp. 2321.6]
MNSVRVTAIACLMPLSELDEDPFLVDDRGQHDMCTQWAAARDYHLTCRLSLHHLRADHGALWRDVEAGLVDVFVAPNRRALENAIDNAAEFTARCAEARGAPGDHRPRRAGLHPGDEVAGAPPAVDADGRVQRLLSGRGRTPTDTGGTARRRTPRTTRGTARCRTPHPAPRTPHPAPQNATRAGFPRPFATSCAESSRPGRPDHSGRLGRHTTSALVCCTS